MNLVDARRCDYARLAVWQLLEAHQSDGDTAAVNLALLQLGQFRLQRHLADTSSGVELSFAQLEMTDMDLSGALEHFAAVS